RRCCRALPDPCCRSGSCRRALSPRPGCRVSSLRGASASETERCALPCVILPQLVLLATNRHAGGRDVVLRLNDAEQILPIGDLEPTVRLQAGDLSDVPHADGEAVGAVSIDDNVDLIGAVALDLGACGGLQNGRGLADGVSVLVLAFVA